MSGLTGLCACVCVQSRSEAFFLPCFWLHMGGKRNVEQVRSFPPLQELRSEKKKKAAKKPTPAAFPLRLFQEISNHSAEAALCAKASIVLSVQRTALLCVSTTSFGSRYSLQRLMFADLPHTSETTDNSPTTVPPASLVSVFFRSVENQELPQIMLRFNQLCRAFFFFFGTVLQHPSKTSLRRRSTRSFGDVCFLFDVLSDLPTPCVRGNDV